MRKFLNLNPEPQMVRRLITVSDKKISASTLVKLLRALKFQCFSDRPGTVRFIGNRLERTVKGADRMLVSVVLAATADFQHFCFSLELLCVGVSWRDYAAAENSTTVESGRPNLSVVVDA